MFKLHAPHEACLNYHATHEAGQVCWPKHSDQNAGAYAMAVIGKY